MNHIHPLFSYCYLLLLVNVTGIISLNDAFERYMIVPQCIPNSPKDLVSVIFVTKEVYPGNYVHPFETINAPFVSYPNNPSSLYTIVLFDPDTPFLYQPMGGQMVRVLFMNIPGKDVHKGDRLTPYVPHIPFPGSGPHRAVYLVYKQPNRVQITPELRFRFSTNLTNFEMNDFAKEFKLGDPVAGNFYVSELSVCDFNQTQDKKSVYEL